MDIFISVGRTFTDEQEAFLTALISILKMHGANPRIIGRTDPVFKEPLKQIKEVMGACSGLVVVAHERLSAEQVSEFRDTPKARRLTDVAWSTPWNHAETAMAYALSLPVFVICQEGVRQDGMLDRGLPWAVHEARISGGAFSKEDLSGGLVAWLREIERTPRQPAGESPPAKVDLDKLTMGDIFRGLTASHLKALVVAIFVVVSAIATAGYYVGSQSVRLSMSPTIQGPKN